MAQLTSRSMHRICLFALAVAILGRHSSEAFVIKFGACPTPTVKSGFDLSQYLGEWFEYARYPVPFELGNTCVTATYTANGEVVDVVNAAIVDVLVFGVRLFRFPVSIEGIADVPDDSAPAKLRVAFFTDEASGPANYWVVDTDYTRYSVVFSCQPFLGLINFQSAWILTRDSAAEPGNIDDIRSNLQSFNIDPDRFIVTRHFN